MFSLKLLEKICVMLEKSLVLNELEECTIEANPYSITNDFLRITNDFPWINRISLGIQSFSKEALEYVGRFQTNENVTNSLKILSANPRLNISIDLINGLPFTTINEDMKVLREILRAHKNINHLSCYDLSIEEGSQLYTMNDNALMLDEKALEEYEIKLQKTLATFKFKQYEISNFSRKSHESTHNLAYWNYQDYIGLGPSAHGKVGAKRYINKNSIEEYTRKNYRIIEEINIKAQVEEILLMGLRTQFGIQKTKIKAIHENASIQIDLCIKEKWKKYFKNNKNYYILNKAGFKILNTILISLFDALN